jgi:hypothetical protein
MRCDLWRDCSLSSWCLWVCRWQGNGGDHLCRWGTIGHRRWWRWTTTSLYIITKPVPASHLNQRLLRLQPLPQQQWRCHGLRGRSSPSRVLPLRFRRHIHLNKSYVIWTKGWHIPRGQLILPILQMHSLLPSLSLEMLDTLFLIQVGSMPCMRS